MTDGDTRAGMRVIIIALAVFLLAIIIVNPIIEEQRMNAQTGATLNFNLGDEVLIDDGLRQQREPSIWGDIIVYRSSASDTHYDIRGYNISTDNNLMISNANDYENEPFIQNNTVVWRYSDSTPDRNFVKVKFLNNLTTYIIWHDDYDSQVNNPKLYDNILIYENSSGLICHDILANTSFQIKPSIIDSPQEWHIWEDYVVIANRDDATYYLYDIDEDTIIDIESPPTDSYHSCDIYEDCVLYVTRNPDTTNASLEIYEISTAQTSILFDDNPYFYYDSGVCLWGNLALFRELATNQALKVYDIDTDNIYSVVDDYRVHTFDLYDGIISYARHESDSAELDLYYVPYTYTTSPTPPDGEDGAVSEFLSENWIYIATIILVMAVLLFVEGYFYNWEHTKKINERFNIGLIVSAIVIAIILIYWGLVG